MSVYDCSKVLNFQFNRHPPTFRLFSIFQRVLVYKIKLIDHKLQGYVV